MIIEFILMLVVLSPVAIIFDKSDYEKTKEKGLNQ